MSFFRLALLLNTCLISIFENIFEKRGLLINLAFSVLKIKLISFSSGIRLPGNTQLTLLSSWKHCKYNKKHKTRIFLWQNIVRTRVKQPTFLGGTLTDGRVTLAIWKLFLWFWLVSSRNVSEKMCSASSMILQFTSVSCISQKSWFFVEIASNFFLDSNLITPKNFFKIDFL